MDYIYIVCGEDVDEVVFVNHEDARIFVETHNGYDCIVERPIRSYCNISFTTIMITCVNGDTYILN